MDRGEAKELWPRIVAFKKEHGSEQAIVGEENIEPRLDIAGQKIMKWEKQKQNEEAKKAQDGSNNAL